MEWESCFACVDNIKLCRDASCTEEWGQGNLKDIPGVTKVMRFKYQEKTVDFKDASDLT